VPQLRLPASIELIVTSADHSWMPSRGVRSRVSPGLFASRAGRGLLEVRRRRANVKSPAGERIERLAPAFMNQSGSSNIQQGACLIWRLHVFSRCLRFSPRSLSYIVFREGAKEAWLRCKAVILGKPEVYLLESIENFYRSRTVVERWPQEYRQYRKAFQDLRLSESYDGRMGSNPGESKRILRW